MSDIRLPCIVPEGWPANNVNVTCVQVNEKKAVITSPGECEKVYFTPDKRLQLSVSALCNLFVSCGHNIVLFASPSLPFSLSIYAFIPLSFYLSMKLSTCLFAYYVIFKTNC